VAVSLFASKTQTDLASPPSRDRLSDAFRRSASLKRAVLEAENIADRVKPISVNSHDPKQRPSAEAATLGRNSVALV